MGVNRIRRYDVKVGVEYGFTLMRQWWVAVAHFAPVNEAVVADHRSFH